MNTINIQNDFIYLFSSLFNISLLISYGCDFILFCGKKGNGEKKKMYKFNKFNTVIDQLAILK